MVYIHQLKITIRDDKLYNKVINLPGVREMLKHKLKETFTSTKVIAFRSLFCILVSIRIFLDLQPNKAMELMFLARN